MGLKIFYSYGTEFLEDLHGSGCLVSGFELVGLRFRV